MPKIAGVGAWIALALIGAMIALAVASHALFPRAVQFGFPALLVVTHITLAIHNHADAEARLWPSLLTLAAFILIVPSAYLVFALADNWSNASPRNYHDGAVQMGLAFAALITLIAFIIANVAALLGSLAGRMTGRLGNLQWRIAALSLGCWSLVILGMLAQAPWAGGLGVVSAMLLSLAWWVSIALQDWLTRIFTEQWPAI